MCGLVTVTVCHGTFRYSRHMVSNICQNRPTYLHTVLEARDFEYVYVKSAYADIYIQHVNQLIFYICAYKRCILDTKDR